MDSDFRQSLTKKTSRTLPSTAVNESTVLSDEDAESLDVSKEYDSGIFEEEQVGVVTESNN